MLTHANAPHGSSRRSVDSVVPRGSPSLGPARASVGFADGPRLRGVTRGPRNRGPQSPVIVAPRLTRRYPARPGAVRGALAQRATRATVLRLPNRPCGPSGRRPRTWPGRVLARDRHGPQRRRPEARTHGSAFADGSADTRQRATGRVRAVTVGGSPGSDLLDFDVDAGREVETLERVDRLAGDLDDVDQALVDPHLEVLAAVLVDVG